MANLNINTFPYYDDFNGEKGFHKILFKPGYAVQARELTQLQTILQTQIQRFGNHIFKDGSVVFGCAESANFNVSFVKILDRNVTGASISNDVLSSFEGKVITGENYGVKAVIKKAAIGSETEVPNLKTFYIQYIATGTDSVTTEFTSSETLSVEGESVKFVVADTGVSHIGYGSLFSVGEGLVYANGSFIVHKPQTILVDRYGTTPSKRVGFIVRESVVNSENDETLLDPAQGSYNYLAPGADRLELTTELRALDLTEEIPEGFYVLFEIEDGQIKRRYNTTQYSELNKTLARRTFDESGDYSVRSFPLILNEHLKTETNNGRYEDGDAGKLVVGVQPGKAYVRGYEYELFATDYLEIDKGFETETKQNQSITTGYGNYVVVQNVSGIWPINSFATVDLKAGSTTVGTARVRELEYVDGTKYNLYLYDVSMTTGAFTAVTSIVYSTGNASATIVLTNNIAEVKKTTENIPIFEAPYKNLSTLTDGSFVYRKVFPVTSLAVNQTSSIQVVVSAPDSWAFTTASKNDVIVVNNLGVIQNVDSATVSGTTLTVNLTSGSTHNGNITVLAKVRKTLEANTKELRRGRYVKISTGTPGTGPFNLGYYDVVEIESIYAASYNPSATNITSPDHPLYYPADPTTDSNWTDVTSQFILDKGHRDSKYDFASITPIAPLVNKKLIVKLTYFRHAVTSGYFSVDSYPKPTVTALGAEMLDETSEINWYDIPTYISQGKKTFDLRNCLDYRPTVQMAADGDSTTIVGAPVNPSSASSFITGFVHPAPSEEFIGDLQYHLPRIDRVILDSEGVFSVIKGIASLTPVRPRQPENSMTLGYVEVAPYPSLSPYLANQAGKMQYACRVSVVDNRRFTMRDIGEIHKRIDRLEYYTSLSLLEQSTTNMLVPNDAGEDRFKNGILVDSFIGHNVGNVLDENYNCSIADGELRPAFEVDNIDLTVAELSGVSRKANDAILVVRQLTTSPSYRVGQVVSNELGAATGTIKHVVPIDTLNGFRWVRLYLNDVVGTFGAGNTITTGLTTTGVVTWDLYTPATTTETAYLYPSLVVTPQNSILATLPYTHRVYAQNPYASKTRNAVSQLLFTFNGELKLTPAVDIWTDTNVLPAVQVNVGGTADNWENLERAWGTQWGSWETFWQGTTTASQTRNQTLNNVQVSTTEVTETNTQRQQRIGTGLNVDTRAVTTDLGNRVVSTALIPFMRSTVVQFSATRMKPNTRVYAYFDGTDVTEHCRATGNQYGTPLIVNASGTLSGQFRIPANTFTVGSKTLMISDSPSLPDVKTFATATFTASGLAVTERNTIVSTQVPEITFSRQTQVRDVTTSRITGTTTNVTVVPLPTPIQQEEEQPRNRQNLDPIAQTFFVTNNPGGAFLSKIDVYFKTKSTRSPITLQVREVVNGYPGETIVPFSSVTLEPKDVNVSSDASAVTEFKFETPIYLMNDTEYCFVMLPAGNDENYEVWVSELGQNQIGTTQRIDKQPYSGVLFVSSNNRTWTAIQSEDIKFTLYQCDFDKTQSGTVKLKNSAIDYLTFTSVTGMGVGDEVIFKTGATITGTGAIKYLDTKNNIAKVLVSSGSSTVSGTMNIGAAAYTVLSREKKIVNALSPSLGYLDFNNTDLTWTYRINAETGNSMSVAASLQPSGTTILPNTKSISSVSDIASTFEVTGTLITDARNVSPAIDLSKTGCIVITNLISESDETSQYISRRVVLDDGQESEDLRVYLTANLPSGSSVKVYAKLLNDTDTAAFSSRPWTELTVTPPVNRVGFKEYVYSISSTGATTSAGGLLNDTDGYVYTSGSAQYFGFKTFAIKIVLLSSDKAAVPIIRDMRAVALMV